VMVWQAVDLSVMRRMRMGRSEGSGVNVNGCVVEEECLVLCSVLRSVLCSVLRSCCLCVEGGDRVVSYRI
jgi:hypothetical protein